MVVSGMSLGDKVRSWTKFPYGITLFIKVGLSLMSVTYSLFLFFFVVDYLVNVRLQLV